MKNYVILIPTKIEAQLVKGNNRIVISGISTRTIKTLKNLNNIAKLSIAVLIGFAGRLDDRLNLNGTYNVTKVTNGRHQLYLSPINNKWQNVSLITVKKPVSTKIKKDELAKHAQIVDMESFYFTEFCLNNDITPYMIRIISDNCDRKLTDFFLRSAFMETKTELANAVRTIEPLLS